MSDVSIGSGSDKLQLGVSENRYQGDAQFTVSVDGQQVGGTLTTTATHGSGPVDFVNVFGDWTLGNHTVTVNFLDENGATLGAGTLKPVTAWDRLFSTGFIRRATSGSIPVNTRSAQVVVTFDDRNPVLGNYNNAYADNLSFTVNDPDPAKRDARLALLARMRAAMHAVADFSRIEG